MLNEENKDDDQEEMFGGRGGDNFDRLSETYKRGPKRTALTKTPKAKAKKSMKLADNQEEKKSESGSSDSGSKSGASSGASPAILRRRIATKSVVAGLKPSQKLWTYITSDLNPISGNPDLSFDMMWPINSKLNNPEFKEEMRLVGVNYKMNARKRICGLRLNFNNGISSPAVETEEERKEPTSKWEQADFMDPADKVGSIETYVSNENGKYSIQALRFRDQNGVVMQCITQIWPLQESWSHVATNAAKAKIFESKCIKAEIPDD